VSGTIRTFRYRGVSQPGHPPRVVIVIHLSVRQAPGIRFGSGATVAGGYNTITGCVPFRPGPIRSWNAGDARARQDGPTESDGARVVRGPCRRSSRPPVSRPIQFEHFDTGVCPVVRQEDSVRSRTCGARLAWSESRRVHRPGDRCRLRHEYRSDRRRDGGGRLPTGTGRRRG
jgi:hypothetical protein